jgi:hypothetical protein
MCFAGPAVAEDNFLAPAEQGKIACFKPNPDKKTCWVISVYKKLDDGKYQTSDRARFRNTSDYEIRSSSILTIKNGRLCGIVEKSDFDQARFFHLGDEVIKQDLEDLRAQVEEQFKEKFGKEYCSAFSAPTAEGLITVTNFVDGTEVPQGTSLTTMIWITHDDGYKLR